jgi:hypothetical protein
LFAKDPNVPCVAAPSEIDPMTWQEVAFAALVVLALTAAWYRYSISTGTVAKVLELTSGSLPS